MTSFEWITTVLTVLTVLALPALLLVVRMAMRWTRTEDKLGDLADDIKQVINENDKVHTEMFRTMREDRAATDRRLRWLEEALWRGGHHPS